MAQLNIILNLDELTETVLNSDMNSMMNSLTVTVFNAYMEVEHDRFIKAANYERTDHRMDQRNGYYERNFMLSAGKVKLRVSNNPKFEKALEILDNRFEDAIQYQLEPQAYHVSLRTTNSVERLNREIRRRDRVIGIYPNVASAERLIGSLLLDYHKEWVKTGRKF